MKKHLFFLLSIFTLSVSVKAQSWPDSVASKEVQVALKGDQLALIWALWPQNDKGSSDAMNLGFQLAKYKKADGSFDTTQFMTVKVPYRVVTKVYEFLGDNKESITAQDNNEMKPILKDQLLRDVDSTGTPKHVALLLALKAIDDQHTRATNAIKAEGKRQVEELKVQ